MWPLGSESHGRTFCAYVRGALRVSILFRTHVTVCGERFAPYGRDSTRRPPCSALVRGERTARTRPPCCGRTRARNCEERVRGAQCAPRTRPPCCGTGRDTHVASALLRTCALGAHCALGSNAHVSALSRTCVRKAPHSVGASLAEPCTCPPCPAPMSAGPGSASRCHMVSVGKTRTCPACPAPVCGKHSTL